MHTTTTTTPTHPTYIHTTPTPTHPPTYTHTLPPQQDGPVRQRTSVWQQVQVESKGLGVFVGPSLIQKRLQLLVIH